MSVKRNFAYQLIYEILIILLPLLTSPYLARVIGADGLGEYGYSYSVAFYFVLVGMMGIKNYGNREIARVSNDRTKTNVVFSSIYCVHLLFSGVCFGIYLVYCFFLSDNRLYAILQIPYVLSAIFDISWLYFGLEKFKMTVIRSSVVKILTVVAIFALVKKPDDLWRYCLIMSIGHLLSQLLLWLPMRKIITFVKPSKGDCCRHLKPMFVLFIPTIAISLYRYMDKIMLGALSSKADVGYYENAEKIINIPSTLIGAFGTVMLPKISKIVTNKNVNSSRKYTDTSIEYLMCLAMAMFAGISGVATNFSVLFWGEEFYYSGVIMMILSITIPFISFADVIRTQYLIPQKRDREYTISVVIGALVNLLANLVLIPRVGAVGAAVGTVMAEITVASIQSIAVRKGLPIAMYLRKILFFLIPAIVTFSCTFFMRKLNLLLFIELLAQISIGVAIYVGIVSIYFYKTKNVVFLNCLGKLGIRKKN